MHEKDFDDFWNLSDLVPKSRKKPTVPPSRDITAAEVTAPPVRQGTRPLETPVEHFVPPHTAKELQPAEVAERTYRPDGGLLTEVRIYPWKNVYDYYEPFCRQAKRLAGVVGKEAPAVDFFSYMPQYAQMTRTQMDYYLWWRTNFQAGKCLKAAYSYLLLYLYELINLDTAIDPITGRENMLRLWLHYRVEHPRLDVLVREWLCDYCLIHRLPPPALPTEELTQLIGGCRLREFYVTATDGTESMIDALLYFGSNYDYKKSKFYKPETAALFDKALRGAVGVALDAYEAKNAQNAARGRGFCTVSRDAYSGAVCSCRQKRRIEVDYLSFSHTHELRYLVTDVLKYAENAVRTAAGVKSRLTVYGIDADLREKLNAYLASTVPQKPARRTSGADRLPDYEKRYDLPKADLSPAHAAAIEAASWQVTERLVSAFVDENEKSPVTGLETEPFEPPVTMPVKAETAPAGAPPKTPIFDTLPADAPPNALASALGEWLPFVRLCAAGDGVGQRAFALSKGSMPDAVADRVNTLATEVFGDVILEEENGVYAVIPDYRADLEEEGVL